MEILSWLFLFWLYLKNKICTKFFLQKIHVTHLKNKLVSVYQYLDVVLWVSCSRKNHCQIKIEHYLSPVNVVGKVLSHWFVYCINFEPCRQKFFSCFKIVYCFKAILETFSPHHEIGFLTKTIQLFGSISNRMFLPAGFKNSLVI